MIYIKSNIKIKIDLYKMTKLIYINPENKIYSNNINMPKKWGKRKIKQFREQTQQKLASVRGRLNPRTYTAMQQNIRDKRIDAVLRIDAELSNVVSLRARPFKGLTTQNIKQLPRRVQALQQVESAISAYASRIYLYHLYYDAYVIKLRSNGEAYLKYVGPLQLMFQSKVIYRLTPFVAIIGNHNKWADYPHKYYGADNLPVANTEGQMLNYFENTDVIKDAAFRASGALGSAGGVLVFKRLTRERVNKNDAKLEDMPLYHAYVNSPNIAFRGFKDSGNMMCVPEVLYHHIQLGGRHKKKKLDDIIDLLEYHYSIDEEGEYGKRGYTSQDIKRVLDHFKTPYKLLDIEEEVFMHDLKRDTKDHKAHTFVAQVYDNHLYYCTDKEYILSLGQRESIKDSNGYIHKDNKKAKKEFDGIVLEQESLMTDYIEEFKNDNTVRKVKLHDDKIVKIEYDNHTIYANPNKEIVEQICNNLEIEFTNQNLTSLGIKLFYELNPEHKKSSFNPSVFSKINTFAGIVREFDCWDGEEVIQVDIIKSRTNAFMHNELGPYPVFSICDEIELYDGKLKLGCWYWAETDNFFPMHGHDFYSTEFLIECEGLDIPFKITHQLIAHNWYPEDYGRTFCEKTIKASPDNYKIVNNSTVGYFGRTIDKCKKGYIETNYQLAVAKFYDTPNIGSVYNLKDKIQTERIRAKHLRKDGYDMVDIGTIEIDENTKQYLVQKTHADILFDNDLPIYNKILENEYLNVYKLYCKIGGKLLKVKTDCVIVEAPDSYPEYKDEIGGYQKEEVCNLQYMKRVEYTNDKNLIFESLLDWKEVCQVEDNDWENYFEKLIPKLPNKSMLITGLAGFGKSEIVKHTKYFNSEGTLKLAFTNKACEGLLGKTICKYFGINFETGAFCRKKMRKLKDIHHIIVDECFMCPAYCMKVFMEAKRLYPHISWIMIGDTEQTRPVKQEYINWLNTKVFYDLCDGNVLKLITNIRNPLATSIYKKIIAGGTPECTAYFKESHINICRTNKLRCKLNDYYMEKYCDENALYIPNEDYHDKAQDVWLQVGMPVMSIITDEELGLVNSGMHKIKSLNPIKINDETFSEEEFMKFFVVCYAMTNHKVQSITINEPFVIHEWFAMTPRERYTAYSRGTHQNKILF